MLSNLSRILNKGGKGENRARRVDAVSCRFSILFLFLPQRHAHCHRESQIIEKLLDNFLRRIRYNLRVTLSSNNERTRNYGVIMTFQKRRRIRFRAARRVKTHAAPSISPSFLRALPFATSSRFVSHRTFRRRERSAPKIPGKFASCHGRALNTASSSKACPRLDESPITMPL